MHVGYVRVSTIEQNEARQLEAMKQYPIERMFIEKASAKDTNRPRLQELLAFVRDGDVVHIHDFSRLARSVKDLLEVVEKLNAKGVALVSNKENIDSSTPTGKLMLTMIGAINEFERTNLLERQREGVAIAKRDGAYKGRKGVTVNCVLPGNIDTDMMRSVPEDILSARIKGMPMQRLGQPEEIAALVTFLASDEASYVSGACIICSGASVVH